VKNGFVVTWQTNTNFHFGVAGKLPTPAPAAPAFAPVAVPDPLPSESPLQADSSAVAASDALAKPAPPSNRRRVRPLRPSVSIACSTTGSTVEPSLSILLSSPLA